MSPAARARYHHGDLRRRLIEEAVRLMDEKGPAAISLRELARRVGVSHAAPAHHFPDKTALLTAVAAEGFDLLADELVATYEATGSFLEVGVAYVRFALQHTAHFAVMFRPDLYRRDDPALAAASERATSVLYGPIRDAPIARRDDEVAAAAVAAWSLVHGYATLLLNGNLPESFAHDPEVGARSTASYLFAEKSRVLLRGRMR